MLEDLEVQDLKSDKWTPEQTEELLAIREMAKMEMVQARDICENCRDRFQVAKTYHYVYKKGRDKLIPKQFQQMAARSASGDSIWTPEFTREAIRIAQDGITKKMEFVKEDFYVRFNDDIETYAFSGCAKASAAMLLIAMIPAILLMRWLGQAPGIG